MSRESNGISVSPTGWKDAKTRGSDIPACSLAPRDGAFSSR
jgi:hypothetical protein